MREYWIEFSQVALAHLLAVVSPGPDFAIVVRQSLSGGRRVAIWTALGIGTAIFLHLGYSLLGLGVLLRTSPVWLQTMRCVGAAYLAWIGLQVLLARPNDSREFPADGKTVARPGAARAFAKGFLTNALNPKATLFFVSLFVFWVRPETPPLVRAVYGTWMAFATATWFSLVAVLFTNAAIQTRFRRFSVWIDRGLGVVLLSFAGALLLSVARS